MAPQRELEPALEGKLEEHHRFLLRLQLQRLEAAEKDLAVQAIRADLKQIEVIPRSPQVEELIAGPLAAISHSSSDAAATPLNGMTARN